MDTSCLLCHEGIPHQHREESLAMEKAKLQEDLRVAHLQIDELKGQLELILSEKFRALDEWEKSRRLNGVLQERFAKIAEDFMLPEAGMAYKVAGEFAKERNATCAEIAQRIRSANFADRRVEPQQIKYAHAEDCGCSACEAKRKWNCPVCDALLSSPEVRRCVNGHDFRR